MMRPAFYVMLALFVASGSMTAALGYRAYQQRNDPLGGSGGAGVVDTAYRQVPVDSQSKWMTGFTLTERSGRTVRWDDLKGQVRVVSFFFSSCPAMCLQQNHKLREVQQHFDGQQVKFLSITCDPDIDTPERLAEYAEKLEADKQQWLFLTGELTYIRRVAGELFSVALDKQTHSERFLVYDKWGNLRGTYHWNKLDEITELKQLVAKLVDETEPPAEEKNEGDRGRGTGTEGVVRSGSPLACTPSP